MPVLLAMRKKYAVVATAPLFSMTQSHSAAFPTVMALGVEAEGFASS